MRQLLIILMALISLQFHAQSKQTKLLVGKWSWIETSGGFGGGMMTPKTESYAITIEFTRKNVFKSYKDGVFNMQNNVKYVVGKSIYSAEPVTLIMYYKGKEKDMSMMNDSFEFRGKDTLVLKQECHDCYSRTFVRVKR